MLLEHLAISNSFEAYAGLEDYINLKTTRLPRTTVAGLVVDLNRNAPPSLPIDTNESAHSPNPTDGAPQTYEKSESSTGTLFGMGG